MSFSSLEKQLSTYRRARVVGLGKGARGWVLQRLSKALARPLFCVAADEDAAFELYRDLCFFFGGEGARTNPQVALLPADDALPWDELVPDNSLVADRLGTLHHLQQGTPLKAIVTHAKAVARRVLPVKSMDALSEIIGLEQDVGRDGLARKLAEMGFRNVPLVEDVGTFSMRGDILDVFAPLSDRPVRLEFFGDTIESMREFDPGTQRTPPDAPKVTQLVLLPARELLFSETAQKNAERALKALAEKTDIPTSRVREKVESIREGITGNGLEGLLPGFFTGGLDTVFDYLDAHGKKPLLYLDDASGMSTALEELANEVARSHQDAVDRGELTFGPEAHFLSTDELTGKLLAMDRVESGGLPLALELETEREPPIPFTYGTTQDLREEIRSHHGEEGALSPLLSRLGKWRDEGITTLIACGTKGQADRLRRLLADRNTVAQVHDGPFPDDPTRLFSSSVWAHLMPGEVSAGFVDTQGKLAVLSDEDIFGARARRRSKRKGDGGLTAEGFKQLKEGDLVVHQDFGVARYNGLLKMQVAGVPGDFLVLEYAGRDKVYLPVSRMRLVSRFSGGDPSKVALDRLGTGTWEKTKARVKENLLKMAAELLQLYAARRAHPGHAYKEPDRYYRQFEADFAFDETPDQQRAIDDTLADMSKSEPMDRLICGDVGYGKTEVAMRAAFRAVLDRKQVAVLVPTTLLAHQHFQSFTKRFEGYPVTVDVVSGLRKSSDARETLKKAAEHRLDVLIGTHKLLGGEVSFKDLGLIIVDEEHRFGVKQKEQLKKLKTQVDVLTLSATPIPRTLNMAMSGIRDMSLITTPPADRRSIRTFVNRFDPGLIKEAIERELKRGGQVFFVHNRVSSIHSMEKFLKELVPQATVVVGHGQMPEGKLEKVMLDFIERRANILLCTSIIESGIDIPAANTMVVNRADQFGLAALYQLRGRVGRSKERAYAYLMVPARRAVTKDAERRLEVLQAFTELGAGFSIASHDLEIRGAGSLLGAEQSGSIEAVGFDLYTQMLEEAVAQMQGEPIRTVVEPDVNLPLPALLPDLYVPDVHQRLVLYKRLASAMNEGELEDIRAELIDRYGDAPVELDNLCELMRLKMRMRDLRLRSMDAGPGRLVVTLGPDALLDPRKIATLVQKSKGHYRLTPEMKLVVTFEGGGANLPRAAQATLVDLEGCAIQE